MTDAAEDIHDYRRSISDNSNDFYDMFDVTDEASDDDGEKEIPVTTSNVHSTQTTTTAVSKAEKISTTTITDNSRPHEKTPAVNTERSYVDTLRLNLTKTVPRIIFTIGITFSLGIIVLFAVVMGMRWCCYIKRKRTLKTSARSLPAMENDSHVPVSHIDAKLKSANLGAHLPSYLDVVSKNVLPPSYNVCANLALPLPETNETERDDAKLIVKT